MDDWRGRGKEAVAADARQGTGGRARGGGMPVPDDAGGSGEAGGRGVPTSSLECVCCLLVLDSVTSTPPNLSNQFLR